MVVEVAQQLSQLSLLLVFLGKEGRLAVVDGANWHLADLEAATLQSLLMLLLPFVWADGVLHSVSLLGEIAS